MISPSLKSLVTKLQKLGLEVKVEEQDYYSPEGHLIVKESLSYSLNIKRNKHSGYFIKGIDPNTKKKKNWYQILQIDEKGTLKAGEKGTTQKRFFELTKKLIENSITLKELQYEADKEAILFEIYKKEFIYESDFDITYFNRDGKKIKQELLNKGLIKIKKGLIKTSRETIPFVANILVLTPKGKKIVEKIEKAKLV